MQQLVRRETKVEPVQHGRFAIRIPSRVRTRLALNIVLGTMTCQAIVVCGEVERRAILKDESRSLFDDSKKTRKLISAEHHRLRLDLNKLA